MTDYTYRCLPAPRRAKKTREHRSPADAFVAAMEAAIAEQAAQGWEYLRCDLVPMETKNGWFSAATEIHQGVLVFRRPAAAASPRFEAPAEPRGAARPEPVLGRGRPEPVAPEVPRLGAARLE